MSPSAGVNACCISGQIHDGSPSGYEETIGGVPTYIAEPPDKSRAKSAIFLGDMFGYKLPNIRLVADAYAKSGLYVYVPDTLFDDPIPYSFLNNAAPSLNELKEHGGFLDKSLRSTKVAVTLGPWILRHRESITKPIIDRFINAVKKIPGTVKVGAVGFCWGGRYAVLTTHYTNEVGGLDAAYVCHPSLLEIPRDFNDVVRPLSLAIGDQDSLVSSKDLEKIRVELSKRASIPTEIRVYEDQVHGFALRGDWSSDKDKIAMDNAARQGIAWLHKYLS